MAASERTPSARATTAGSVFHVAVTDTPEDGIVSCADDPLARLRIRVGHPGKCRSRGGAGAGAVGGQRRDQDRLSAPDRVRRTALAGARLAEVDRVAVEPHAHAGVGSQVVHRPRRGHHEPVTLVAHDPGGGAGCRDRCGARARGREHHQQCQRRKSESQSESGQSTHPARQPPRRPRSADQILLATVDELPGEEILARSLESRKDSQLPHPRLHRNKMPGRDWEKSCKERRR